MYFALAAFLITAMAFSQGITTANMQGLVTDEQGEPLFGANIVAVHTPSGTTYGAISNEEGIFYLPNIRVGGPYAVNVTYVGFQDRSFDGINLGLGQSYNLKVEMVEGVQLAEVVVTSVSGGIIDPDRTGPSVNLSRETIDALPTINRSINDFTRLTPQSSGNAFAGTSADLTTTPSMGIFTTTTSGWEAVSLPVQIRSLWMLSRKCRLIWHHMMFAWQVLQVPR